MKHEFVIDNRTNKHILVMCLVGYKPDLWNKVFDRFIKYMDLDADVCLVSSGTSNKHLELLAFEHKWSYLTTKENNLCLAQNECIKCHPNAEYIFKIDEDMFVTKHSFSRLLEEMKHLEEHSDYVPGAIMPLINVNATCLPRLLKLTNHWQAYFETFGKPYVSDGRTHHDNITFDANISKWLWYHISIDSDIKQLDKTNHSELCATRFSIGMVLFKRDVWQNMGQFPYTPDDPVEYKRIGLGEDEKALCSYCMMKARPMFICNDVLVGHLSYGPTTKEMMSFFKTHQELF